MASVNKKKKTPAKKARPASGKTRTAQVRTKPGEASPVLQAPSGKEQQSLYFVLGALAITLIGLFSLPNFHYFLPEGSFLSKVLVFPWLLLVGFIALVYAFRQIPGEALPPPMPKWQAYLGFAFFFGLCLFWRFYRPLEPSAPFWFDNHVVTWDIANIIDVHQNYLLFPWGQREAFFPYLTAALWTMLPNEGGVWIVRFSCTLIDLLAIWGLYLLGSSIRGRRMGLILMALWAVSLPMTIWNYFGMGQNTAALAAIWTFLFFYRLTQRPSFARFIYWALAVAFGAYCYVPYRPWTPTMITLVLGWILFGSKEKPKGNWTWTLMGALWLSWTLLFFYKNNYLPQGLADFLSQSWVLTLTALVLGAAYLKIALKQNKNETENKVFGWATGALLIALLMSPLYLHPLYSQHTSSNSVFVSDSGPLTRSEGLKAMWHNVVFLVAMMFGLTHEDVSRYPLPHQSYFESFPELCMVIGLALLIARPTWRRTAVLAMATVGVTTFILSNHAHPGRVETSTPMLLLLGAWGLDYVLEVISRESKGKFIGTLVFALFLVLWVWGSNRAFWDIRAWMADMSNDNVIGHQIDKDWHQYRVIVADHYPQFATPALTVLCDQKEAYVLDDPNPIYLEPGEKGKDIVLYMYGATTLDKDLALQNRVREEFPQAQWSVVECPNPDIHRFMLRVLIPMDSLAETPGKLFYIQRVPRDYWRRRFYWKDYGLARGIVWWDERVPMLKAPFPPGMTEFYTARANGEITTPVSGDYTFTTTPTGDVIVLSIDGKTVLSLKPPLFGSLQTKGKIYLDAGVHEVTYLTTFRALTNFRDIIVTPPGGAKEWVLGEPLAASQP